ncbi:uncharacterized protein VTP21DRAFT_4268 [Calcarisporiella thermophila]|uniref:uncharacterized protein n=1 Tax=Calcarisporiella thermophila TaxID=911321 RepID=UPI0037424EEA
MGPDSELPKLSKYSSANPIALKIKMKLSIFLVALASAMAFVSASPVPENQAEAVVVSEELPVDNDTDHGCPNSPSRCEDYCTRNGYDGGYCGGYFRRTCKCY